MKQLHLIFFIFLFFEKNFNNIFFLKNSKLNNFLCFINASQIKQFSIILKLGIFKNNFYLNDISAIDYNSKTLQKCKFKKKYEVLSYYIFTNIKTGQSIIFILNSNKNKNESLSFVFKNANWLERELSEMYGIFIMYKKDYRKLLLDYSKKIYPLKKKFNCENKDEYFFNFFENQICINYNEVIEL